MRGLPLLLAFVLLLPSAASTDAYEDEGVLAPGVVALGGFQSYQVALAVGERVVFVLTGPTEGLGLDATVRALCDPSPTPASCGAWALTGPDSALGGGCGLAHAQGTGTLVVSHVATSTGLYYLGIRPVAATGPVPYHVSITVDGSVPDHVGRGGANVVLGDDATPCAARSVVSDLAFDLAALAPLPPA